jgi:hypothetical protein
MKNLLKTFWACPDIGFAVTIFAQDSATAKHRLHWARLNRTVWK